jgi:hypothetical protein
MSEPLVIVVRPTTLELAERVAAYFKGRSCNDDASFDASFAAAALPGCVKHLEAENAKRLSQEVFDFDHPPIP